MLAEMRRCVRTLGLGDGLEAAATTATTQPTTIQSSVVPMLITEHYIAMQQGVKLAYTQKAFAVYTELQTLAWRCTNHSSTKATHQEA